ncbi:MAG: hypothetical protein IPK03_05080 [Bacteroidetes bacterium]|nr:hypothetical protein [Bacteroidota bacterium]
MNSELFDKALKSKLEEIQPAYNAESWKVVQASIKKKNDYHWAFGWIFATLFIGTTAFLWNENRALHKIYSTVEVANSVSNGNSGSTQSAAPIEVNEIPSKEIVVNEIPAAEQNLRTELEEMKRNNQEILASLSEAKRENKHLKQTMRVQLRGGKALLADPEKSKLEQSSDIPPLQLTKGEESEKSKLATKTLVIVGKEGIPNELSNVNHAEQMARTPIKNGDTVQLALTESKEIDSAKTSKNKDLDVNEIPVKMPKPALAKSKFYEIFAGVSTFLKQKSWALGGLAEFRFFKKLSFSLGLETNTIEAGRYKDERDFKDATEENFRDKFKHGIPNQTRIEDIHFTRTVTQIPIHLNYQFRIVNHFVLAPGIGTRLNINQTQTFDYRYLVVGSKPETSEFVQKEKVPVFDNLVFSLGIQYEWKRFLFRAEPFYQWRTGPKQMPSAPKDIIGVQGKILFRIF